MNARSSILLFIALTVMGFIGSVASISSAGWGCAGILISIGLVLVIPVLAYVSLRPVMHRNARGVTLLQAVNSVGMVDIENREDKTAASLPPHQFYEKAGREIVITGVSLHGTFNRHLEVIQQCLELNKKIFVLMLHPNSNVLPEISKIEGKDMKNEIVAALDLIKEHKLHEHPAFKVRFLQSRPPFIGVMLDGDLVPTSQQPWDQNGQIRVQPFNPHASLHEGIILQFRKKQGSCSSAFDFFASALRSQWENDAQEDKNLFS